MERLSRASGDAALLLPLGAVMILFSYLVWTFATKVSSSWRHRLRRSSVSPDESSKMQPTPTAWPLTERLEHFDWTKQEPLKLRPFKPVYHMTMGVRSADPSNLIAIDKNYLDRITIRRNLIEQYGRTVHGYVPGGEDAVQELYTYLLGTHLPTRFPSMFRLSNNGKTFENLVTGRSFPATAPADTLLALRILGETVEDDMFLLKNTPEGHRSVAFVCCFPAGFDPSEKLGKGLEAIHEPVPSFDKIGPSMERFFGKIEVGKNVQRMNWSIQTHQDLFDVHRNHIKKDSEQVKHAEVDIDQTFARMELQTLSRMPATWALLFSFKTLMYPISEIRAEGSGPAVADAVQGLRKGNAPGMWIYKGGVRWADRVCEYLRS